MQGESSQSQNMQSQNMQSQNMQSQNMHMLNMQVKDIGLMKQICLTCSEDFTAHSFNRVCNTLEGGHIFYTKISNASKYNDTAGIVAHCTNYLNYVQPDKWSWIIDFEDFGLKHTLGLNTGIQLSKLINKYGGLHELIVINTNVFVEQMLKMIKLTLDKEYHNCIKVLHNNAQNNADFQKKINEWTPTDAHGRTLLETLL